jgi:hypothetical protein
VLLFSLSGRLLLLPSFSKTASCLSLIIFLISLIGRIGPLAMEDLVHAINACIYELRCILTSCRCSELAKTFGDVGWVP